MRDILIFPKFNNVDSIQNIRSKYDRLYSKINPHITVVFPFLDNISDEQLVNKLKEIFKNYKQFEVEFNGISLSSDNYIYLNCVKGSDIIIKLHDEIYNKVLPSHLRHYIKYIPHITLGESNTIDNIDIKDIFSTTIDEIAIEKIGNNEESIIIDTIKL